MRFCVSMAALIMAAGACLIAVPGQAAPVGAIKDYVLPPQFGDTAPVITVQQDPQHRNGQRRGNPQAGNPPAGGQRQGIVQQHGGQRQGGGGGGQQFNRGGGGQHFGGGGGYRGGGYRDHDRGDDSGAIAAGALGGLLLGAIIANENQRNSCSRRPGYDPRSRTFIGQDHRRYRCP